MFRVTRKWTRRNEKSARQCEGRGGEGGVGWSGVAEKEE